MATASQVVEQKVLEDDIKDVKQKIHVLEQKINVHEDGIKAFQRELEHETADAARMQLLEQLAGLQQRLAGLEQRLAALEQRLAALEQQKVLRMQQQAGGAAGDKRLEMLELLGLWPPPRWLQHSATSTKRPYNLVELAGKAE